MSNIRWSIVVHEEVDRELRSYLARRGTKKVIFLALLRRQSKHGSSS